MFLYGLRFEYYREHNKTKENPIFLVIDENEKYEISLKDLKRKKVLTFIAPNYLSISRLNIRDEMLEYFKNQQPFILSEISFIDKKYDINFGNISLNSRYFKNVETIRNSNKRLVWIFYGRSGIGKSYLANYLSDIKSIYETDSSESLPNYIEDDIIVVGNKYKYSLEDIKERVFDAKIIEVYLEES